MLGADLRLLLGVELGEKQRKNTALAQVKYAQFAI